jgi:hypothetical protein
MTRTIKTMFIASCCLVAAALAMATRGLACPTSIFTSVAEKDCRPVSSLNAGRMIVSGTGDNVFECPAPEGMRLYLVDSDSSSWYAIERKGKTHSFENVVVYERPPGNFPSVGKGGKVEWLQEGGQPAGMIFRVSYQDKDGGQNFSRLFTIDLRGTEPAIRGLSHTNAAARRLFDDCAR